MRRKPKRGMDMGRQLRQWSGTIDGVFVVDWEKRVWSDNVSRREVDVLGIGAIECGNSLSVNDEDEIHNYSVVIIL